MMNVSARCSAIAFLTVFLAGCAQPAPTAPTQTSQASSSAPPTPVVTVTIVPLPPLSGPSRTFVFDRELSYRVSDYTRSSRLVLYDNSAVTLEYPTLSSNVLHGRYEEAEGAIGIWWSARIGEPYGTTAELKGDSLTVRYSLMMQMSDFEDAVYVRAR